MSERSKDQVPDKCSLFEGVVLTSVVVVVIGLFSIPTVVYFTNRNEASLDWKSLVFGLYPAVVGNNTQPVSVRYIGPSVIVQILILYLIE